jgi:hypothetical protein
MKNRLFFLFPIIIALLLQACAADEDTSIIAGQVIESGSGNPINQAVVQVTQPQELQQTATTDSSGNFSFDVDPGDEAVNVTLEVSKQGYQTTTTGFKLAPETNVDDLVIELSSSSDDGGGEDDESEENVGGEAGGPASLKLQSISSQAINVSETGGTSHTAFTFLVEDSAGRDVSQGHEIEFEIIRGPGGGESITPETGETNSNGEVTSNLFSGDSSGTVRIEARIERPEVGLTVRSTPVLVSIISGFPVAENFHIVPEVNNFEAFGFLSGEQTNTITASVGDLKNNPVVAGTAVYFWAEGGGNIGDSIVESATDSRGLASVEMRADGSQPTNHPDGIGFVDVFAQTVDVNNEYITKKTKLLFTTRQAVITANPTSFDIGNGGGESFDFTVTDQNGYPMAAGTSITVEVGNGLTVNGDVDIEVPDSFTPGPGVTEFGFSITDADPDLVQPSNDQVTIVVTTPSGYRSSLAIPGSRAKTR